MQVTDTLMFRLGTMNENISVFWHSKHIIQPFYKMN